MRSLLLLLALAASLAAADPPELDVPLRRFGDNRFRVTGVVSASVLSPDGKRLAILSTCEQRRHAIVTILDADSGRPQVVSRVAYEGWETFVLAGLSFSPDGKRLAAVVNKNTAFAIDTATGREVWRATKQEHAYSLCTFDPAGRLIRSFEEELQVTDLTSGRVVARRPVGGGVKLTPDAKTFVRHTRTYSEKEADDLGSLEIGDTATGVVRHTLSIKTDWWGTADGFAISLDGKTLAAVHDKKELHLIDLATGRTRRKWPLTEQHLDLAIYAVSFSQDDATVILKACRRPVCRWETATGKELPPLTPLDLSEFRGRHTSSEWRGVHTAADGKAVFAVSRWGHVERWDAATGKPLPLEANVMTLRFALSPDGKQMVTGDETGRIRVLDLPDGKLVRELQKRTPNYNLRDLALSPDGKLVACVTAKRRVDVHPMAGGPPVSLQPAGEDKYPRRLLWGGDNNTLFAEDVDGSALFDVAAKRAVDPNLDDSIGRFQARTPDGQAFVAIEYTRPGSQDRLVKWDVKKRKVTGPWLKTNPFALLEHNDFPIIVLSSDPAVIALAGADKVVLTGVADRVFAATDDLPEFERSMRFGDFYKWPVVDCLTFTLDAKWMISGGGDCAVKVWEVATAKLVRRFDGHDDRVTQVAVSPDGRSVFSTDESFISQWDLTPPFADLKAKPNELWKAAAGGDPAVGVPAAWALMSNARAFVATRLPPAATPDAEKVTTWVAQLDAAAFADRDAATKELTALGRSVEKPLREALRTTTSAEVRQRLEGLIARFEKAYSPEELRAMRLVQAAEWFKRKEPLTAWAGGAPAAVLTRDATAALARLK